MNLVLLPLYILKFWYLEAPIRLLSYFIRFNKMFFHLFSIPLMIRTFFKPWKNEYRKGLVGFSRFMGMAFKTMFIFAGLFIFMFVLLFEVIIFVGLLAWPLIPFYLL